MFLGRLSVVLKIFVSAVRFRPRPPVSMRPSARKGSGAFLQSRQIFYKNTMSRQKRGLPTAQRSGPWLWFKKLVSAAPSELVTLSGAGVALWSGYSTPAFPTWALVSLWGVLVFSVLVAATKGLRAFLRRIIQRTFGTTGFIRHSTSLGQRFLNIVPHTY